MSHQLKYYLRGFVIVITIYLALLIFFLYFLGNQVGVLGEYVNYKTTVIIIFLLGFIGVLIRGIRNIQNNEIGIVLFFGKPLFQATTGYLQLFPFCILKKEKNTLCEFTFLSNSITHGRSNPDTYAQTFSDHLNARLTAPITFTVSYYIVDYISYTNLFSDRSSLENLIKNRMTSLASIECSKNTLSENISRQESINNTLSAQLANYGKNENWGIKIIHTQLLDFNIGNEITKAQDNVSANQVKIFNGYAEAEVNSMFAFAKGRGLKKLAHELEIDDTLLLHKLDVFSNIFRRKDSLQGNDLQVFQMIMSVFKSNQLDEDGSKKLN